MKDSLVSSVSEHKKERAGIGLFQSRAIVQAHGGAIHVQTEVGRAPHSCQPSGGGREMTKTTLLLVDDDEDIRTQMKWALAADYEVVMAGDRAGALAAFRASRPAVTLLDLGSASAPERARRRSERAVRLLALDSTAKVIVVSGQGDKQNALRAVGAGAYDFLCKPVDMDELRLVLQRCVYVADLEREYPAMQQSQSIDHSRACSAPVSNAGSVHFHPQSGADIRSGPDSR